MKRSLPINKFVNSPRSDGDKEIQIQSRIIGNSRKKTSNQNRELHIELLRRIWLNEGSYKNMDLDLTKEKLVKYSDYLMPYEILPNVQSFQITKLSEYHPILKQYGILKRYKPEYEFEKGHNGRKNKYLKHMFTLLNKNRTSSSKFFKLSELLLTKSICFRLSCIRKIFPTWYKDSEYSFIKRLLKKYNKLNLTATPFLFEVRGPDEGLA